MLRMRAVSRTFVEVVFIILAVTISGIVYYTGQSFIQGGTGGFSATTLSSAAKTSYGLRISSEAFFSGTSKIDSLKLEVYGRLQGIYFNGIDSQVYTSTIPFPFSSGQTIAALILPDTRDNVVGQGYLAKDCPGSIGSTFYDPTLWGGQYVRRAVVGTDSPGYLVDGMNIPSGYNGPFALTVYSKVSSNTLSTMAWRVEIYESGVLKWSYSMNANYYSQANSYQWYESPSWFFNGSKTYTMKLYWPGNVDLYVYIVSVMGRRGGIGYGGAYPSSMIFEKCASNKLQVGYYTRKSDGSYSWTWFSSSNSIPYDGKPHLVAVTLSGGTKSLYIDGALLQTVSGQGDIMAQDQKLYIGGTFWRTFYGTISEVYVYGRGLTSYDMDRLAKAVLQRNGAIDTSGLVAWYRENGISSGKWADSTSNHYDGTLYNAIPFSANTLIASRSIAFQKYYLICVDGVSGSWCDPQQFYQGASDVLKKNSKANFVKITSLSDLDALVRNPPYGAVVVNCHGEMIPMPTTWDSWQSYFQSLARNSVDSGWIFATSVGYPLFYTQSVTCGSSGLNTYLSVVGASADAWGSTSHSPTSAGTQALSAYSITPANPLNGVRTVSWSGVTPSHLFYNVSSGRYLASAVPLGKGFYLDFDGSQLSNYDAGRYTACFAIWLHDTIFPGNNVKPNTVLQNVDWIASGDLLTFHWTFYSGTSNTEVVEKVTVS
jgi:hypothetical protein